MAHATTTTTDSDTATRLRVAIARLSRRLSRAAAGSAEGLSPTRISVLLTVVREGPMRISQLAAAESLNPTMLSRAISSLVQDGLLDRSSDDGDRRAGWVQATPAGRQLAARMKRERTDALARALECLSEEERRQIEIALPALEALAECSREDRR